MPIYKPLIAEAHTPPYKIHKYFARRPWNVFKSLIESYSNEGDIILDPFCGGGVTIYEGLRLNRKVIGFDLNPLSIFIVKNMVKNSYDKYVLKKAFSEISDFIKYLYLGYNDASLEINLPEWYELAYSIKCNKCNSIIILSNQNKISNGRYGCLNPSCENSILNGGYVEPIKCERVGYEYLFSVNKSSSGKEFIIKTIDKREINKIHKHIEFLNRLITTNKINLPNDNIPLEWDRQLEDALSKKNIFTFQDLFTQRNLLINLLLLDYIKKIKIDSNSKEILRLVFSSSLKDTNVMSFTQQGWQSGKPTTWSKHAYWLPNQFCEVNVLSAFSKAYVRMDKCLEYNSKYQYNTKIASNFLDIKSSSNIYLRTLSLDDSDMPENSVDIIITDPPYGKNVQYLELSHFWYPWNKDMYDVLLPNFNKEAVVNRKTFNNSKTLTTYENNLYSVFNKSYKVLKPNKKMILTFNNKDVGAWLSLLIAIFRSGFNLSNEGIIFQSGVDNYKNTAHSKYKGSIYGDFIYIFEKNYLNPTNQSSISEDELIESLDSIFSDNFKDKYTNLEDKNEMIKKTFLEAIPKIQAFVRSQLLVSSEHNLYNKYTNHLKYIYGDKYES